jgi:hypothetical protein
MGCRVRGVRFTHSAVSPATVVPALVAVLLALMTGGCATIEAPAAKLPAFKTVGIVSAVGDEFTLTRAGLAGLADEDRRFSIAAWGIDDLIAARAGALLGRRFQVQPVTYPRASFAARDRDSPFALINTARDDPIKELLRNQVTPQGLDAYLVITAATSPYGSRGRTIAGIGIINRSAVFGASAQLHALYMIRVIDGHTFKVIDKKSASPVDGAGLDRLSGPSRELDASLLPAAQGPAQDQAQELTHDEPLKAAVTDLIERSLPQTLKDLQLIDRSGS